MTVNFDASRYLCCKDLFVVVKQHSTAVSSAVAGGSRATWSETGMNLLVYSLADHRFLCFVLCRKVLFAIVRHRSTAASSAVAGGADTAWSQIGMGLLAFLC